MIKDGGQMKSIRKLRKRMCGLVTRTLGDVEARFQIGKISSNHLYATLKAQLESTRTIGAKSSNNLDGLLTTVLVPVAR
jgi:hypothetical protein